MPTIRFKMSLLLIVMAMFAPSARGQSDKTWNQWGGPHRDFSYPVEGLMTSWPEEGPKRLWIQDLGDGYSGIVTDGRLLFTMFRDEKEREQVAALNPYDGKVVWAYRYREDKATVNRSPNDIQKYGIGPNSTPLVVGGRVFAVGFGSKLHCLDAKTGKLLWSHDLQSDLGGTYVYFGYSASPIAYRDTVIVLVGGKGQGIVAFDQKTGNIVWKGTDFDCSYSSPILIKIEGIDHLVAYMASYIVGVSPENGDLQWSLKHENKYYSTTSISSPVWCPGHRLYFANSNDELGGRMVRLSVKAGRVTAEDVWSNKKISGPQSSPVRVGDVIYGSNGIQTDRLMAVDVKSGRFVWRLRGHPEVSVVNVGSHLLLLDEDGNLSLATPASDGLTLSAKAQVLAGRTWTPPSLHGTTVYVRSQSQITALELGSASK